MPEGLKRMNNCSQNLIEACLITMKDFEEVEVSHIFREKNKVADAMARLSRGNMVIYDRTPDALVRILGEDSCGAVSWLASAWGVPPPPDVKKKN